MIIQGFSVYETIPKSWWIMAYYNVKNQKDLARVYWELISLGLDESDAIEAIEVISNVNNGYTLTINKLRTTIIIISHTSNDSEFFDTFAHELKHAAEYIGEFFGYKSDSEESAWLQGEISKNMFDVIKTLTCKNYGWNIRNT